MSNNALYNLVKEDKNKFALPNFFTILRLIFLPFIIHFLQQGTTLGDLLALLFMGLAAMTDYLDGYFARKLSKKSNVGRMLDPLIDKVTVAATMLVLASHKNLPYWYVAIVILRDLFLLFTGMLIISKKRFVIESNLLGKVASFLFVCVVISYTIGIPYLRETLMILSLFFVPVTIVGYIGKYKHDIKNREITTDGQEEQNV